MLKYYCLVVMNIDVFAMIWQGINLLWSHDTSLLEVFQNFLVGVVLLVLVAHQHMLLVNVPVVISMFTGEIPLTSTLLVLTAVTTSTWE